jgi:hypothetical protein
MANGVFSVANIEKAMGSDPVSADNDHWVSAANLSATTSTKQRSTERRTRPVACDDVALSEVAARDEPRNDVNRQRQLTRCFVNSAPKAERGLTTRILRESQC